MLGAGVYRGAIVLVFSNGAVKTISILIVLTSGDAAHLTQAIPGHTITGCTPTQLQLQITSLAINFSTPAAFPIPLVAKVVDDCGSPHVQGSVVATFSNGDPPLAMLSGNDGPWSATWVPKESQRRPPS